MEVWPIPHILPQSQRQAIAVQGFVEGRLGVLAATQLFRDLVPHVSHLPA